MRRLLLAFVVILGAGWAAGWHVLAGRVGDAVGHAVDAASGPIALACADRTIGGFPFHIRLECRGAGATDSVRGLTASLTTMTAQAAIYRPTTLALDFGGPAEIGGGGLSEPVTLTWDNADGRVATAGDRAAIDASGLKLAWRELNLAFGSLNAEVAPSGGSGRWSTVAARAEAVAAAFAGTALPAFDLDLGADVAAPAAALLTGSVDPRADGLDISALRLAIASGSLDALLSGDLVVSPEGVPDGRLTLSIADVDRLPEFIALLPEGARGMANTVVAGLLAFGPSVARAGRPAREIDVVVDRGKLSIAMLSAGRLPPLW